MAEPATDLPPIRIPNEEALAQIKALQDRVDALEKQLADVGKKGGDSLGKIGAKARELFTKGIGGGELAGAVKDIGEGLEIAGNKAAPFGDRMRSIAGAVGIAARGVLGFAGQVADMASHVLASNAAAAEHLAALERLGPAYAAVEQQAAGTVSAQQALATSQDLLRRGVVAQGRDLGNIAQAARQYSAVFGGDATQATHLLLDAIQRGDRDVLQRFNVHLERSGTAAQNLRAASAQLAAQPIIPPGAADSALSFARVLERIKNTPLFDTGTLAYQEMEHRNAVRQQGDIQRLRTEFDNALQPSLRLVQSMRTLHDQGLKRGNEAFAQITRATREYTHYLNDAARAQQRLGDQALTLGQRVAAAAVVIKQNIQRHAENLEIVRTLRAQHYRGADIAGLGLIQAGQANHALNDLKEQLAQISAEAVRAGGHIENLVRGPGESRANFLRRSIASAREELAVAQDLYETEQRRLEIEKEHLLVRLDKMQSKSVAVVEIENAEREASLSRQQAVLERFQQTVRGAVDAPQTRALVAELNRGLMSGATNIEQLYGRINRLQNQATALAATDSEFARRRVEQLQHEAQVVAGVVDQYNQFRESQIAANDVGVQFAQAFAQNSELTATAAQHFAGSVKGAVDGATASFKSHLAAWITGRETIEQAAKAILHEVLLSIAVESTVKSLFNVAEGIFAAATYQYAKATQHFLAAGVYGAVAVATGLGAAATVPTTQGAAASSAGASAGGGSSTRNTQAAPALSGNGGSGKIEYNFYYTGNAFAPTQQMSDFIVSSMDEAATRGNYPEVMLRNTGS